MSIYVFGYGSLMNMKKICPVIITGLKRALNVAGKSVRRFGVKNAKNHSCNGVLFKVTDSELANLVRREKLYVMKLIDKARVKFAYTKCLTFQPADQIICFYPQPQYVLTKKMLHTKPISQAYLDSCTAGAAKISAAFLADFLAESVVR
jgi:cation transport regulator ChaC